MEALKRRSCEQENFSTFAAGSAGNAFYLGRRLIKAADCCRPNSGASPHRYDHGRGHAVMEWVAPVTPSLIWANAVWVSPFLKTRRHRFSGCLSLSSRVLMFASLRLDDPAFLVILCLSGFGFDFHIRGNVVADSQIAPRAKILLITRRRRFTCKKRTGRLGKPARPRATSNYRAHSRRTG